MTILSETVATVATVDAVSIGFGPAAIAIACVIEEARRQNEPLGSVELRFLERAQSTSWHPELLVDGTDINHSLLRDLVTPRNPQSPFSFAMYLKEKGRMFDFGLLGRPASRREWSDYVSWVASQVSRSVNYGETVREVLPVVERGRLSRLRIATNSGPVETRNLIVSSGSSPHIPDMFLPHMGPTVFHTSEFLSRLNAFGDAAPNRWLVIGSGQSASESIFEIIGRLPEAHILSVHRSIGFRLTQLGQFPNQVFSPRHVDYFHNLGFEQRRQYLANSRSVNYAGIDPDESSRLFSLIYEDGIAGRTRLEAFSYHRVTDLKALENGYDVTLEDVFTGAQSRHTVDAVLLATGYLQHPVPPLLANLQPWLLADPDDGLRIDRDYRIALSPDADVQIFANGLSERSHGISDGQAFSLMALRAERIMQALAA